MLDTRFDPTSSPSWRMEVEMNILVEKAGSGYVVFLPKSDTETSYAVRFRRLEDAQNLARACMDWFPNCTYTEHAKP